MVNISCIYERTEEQAFFFFYVPDSVLLQHNASVVVYGREK